MRRRSWGGRRCGSCLPSGTRRCTRPAGGCCGRENYSRNEVATEHTKGTKGKQKNEFCFPFVPFVCSVATLLSVRPADQSRDVPLVELPQLAMRFRRQPR